MDRWRIDELRRRAGSDETFDAPDVLALVEELARVQRAAALPPEFIVRVARSDADVDRWSACHPLLQATAAANHPADALALASVELRRVLAQHDWPAERWPSGRVERAVADAHASLDGDAATSLRWALRELDRVSKELQDERFRTALRDRAASGDADARAQLREHNVTRLEAAGVVASGRAWDAEGFGLAEDVDLPLPCLALVIRARDPDDVDRLRFSPERRWHALRHTVTPRPDRRSRSAVVTPLRLDPGGDLSLRRIAPRMPTGSSVGAYGRFADLIAEELPAVDVAWISDELSPAWVPLPLDAIGVLCAGTPDADLDVDQLVESTAGRRHRWLDHSWELAYLTEHLDDGW